MKAASCLFVSLCLALSAGAQAQGTQYSPEELDQMLGPIALYPDPLIALILPASTVPGDIGLAAQYVAANGDPSGIDSQPWDPSVKGLAHYPEVLKWMNDNIGWTQALGAAFAMQPSDVMKSIQQLRAEARAAGTLVSTPQQEVQLEGDDIRIVPTSPDMMYVPEYDPDAVYDDSGGYTGPFITFGIGCPVGPWLGYQCDWDDYGIWFGPWQRGWEYRREWRDPHAEGSRWHPDPRRGHDLVRNFYRPGGEPPRVQPMPGERAPARTQARAPGAAARGSVTVTRSVPDYRGYGGTSAHAPSTPAPQSPLYGGYTRGTQTREYSNRGNTSRQAPVRRPAPARKAAPASRSAPSRSETPAPGKDRH